MSYLSEPESRNYNHMVDHVPLRCKPLARVYVKAHRGRFIVLIVASGLHLMVT